VISYAEERPCGEVANSITPMYCLKKDFAKSHHENFQWAVIFAWQSPFPDIPQADAEMCSHNLARIARSKMPVDRKG